MISAREEVRHHTFVVHASKVDLPFQAAYGEGYIVAMHTERGKRKQLHRVRKAEIFGRYEEPLHVSGGTARESYYALIF